MDAPTVEASEIHEEDWSEDTSAEAVRAREEAQLTGAVSKLVMADDQELPMAERLHIFFQYLQDRAQQQPFPATDVLNKAERLDCKEKGIMVLADVLLNSEDILARIKK